MAAFWVAQVLTQCDTFCKQDCTTRTIPAKDAGFLHIGLRSADPRDNSQRLKVRCPHQSWNARLKTTSSWNSSPNCVNFPQRDFRIAHAPSVSAVLRRALLIDRSSRLQIGPANPSSASRTIDRPIQPQPATKTTL